MEAKNLHFRRAGFQGEIKPVPLKGFRSEIVKWGDREIVKEKW